jgi:hypothetical protein
MGFSRGWMCVTVDVVIRRRHRWIVACGVQRLCCSAWSLMIVIVIMLTGLHGCMCALEVTRSNEIVVDERGVWNLIVGWAPQIRGHSLGGTLTGCRDHFPRHQSEIAHMSLRRRVGVEKNGDWRRCERGMSWATEID